MPVVVQGEGFVFGESAREIYRDGFLFDINGDFAETFWPVPAPGHSFGRWNAICRGKNKVRCDLSLNKELWQRDDELPLDATFLPGYEGPLTLINYDLYWYEATRTLSIPADSIILEGGHPATAMRLFLAPANRELVLPGVLRGDDYEFQLPVSHLEPEDLWLLVSATDSQGVLASVGIDFGLMDGLSAGQLRPHNTSGENADILVGCIVADDPFNLCRMEQLPFLGALTPIPTVSEIMHRTVVSHAWMGHRFAQVLQRMPRDLRKLFRGVTAIVISAQVRPSFYVVTTGAVYIDPQDLWLTPQERATINWEPDYRQEFGYALKFLPVSDYLDGNKYAWEFSSNFPEGASREIEDIVLPMAYVLLHELAHANDAIPPALLHHSSDSATPLDLYFTLGPQTATAQLQRSYPLRSALMHDIGNVLYHGDVPGRVISSLTATEVGDEFSSDSANAMYAYASPHEDTASLVEEVLLSYYFGLDKVESFLDVPTAADPDCTDYTLRWGSLNRASQLLIRERARIVLHSVLGEADVSPYLDSVPATSQLLRGVGLCESIEALSARAIRTAGEFRVPVKIRQGLQHRGLAHSRVNSRIKGVRARTGGKR